MSGVSCASFIDRLRPAAQLADRRDPESGFEIHNADALEAPLLSVFKYTTGLDVIDATVTLVGFEGDFSGTGLRAGGIARVTVTGASILSHFTSVLVAEKAEVTVSGSHLGSNGILFTGSLRSGAVYGNVIEITQAGATAWSPASVGGTSFTLNSTNQPP